jgi:hypothetical protein
MTIILALQCFGIGALGVFIMFLAICFVEFAKALERELAASKSDATMLRSQLNRAVEIAEDLSSGDAWKFTGADEKLAALKEEIK